VDKSIQGLIGSEDRNPKTAADDDDLNNKIPSSSSWCEQFQVKKLWEDESSRRDGERPDEGNEETETLHGGGQKSEEGDNHASEQIEEQISGEEMASLASVCVGESTDSFQNGEASFHRLEPSTCDQRERRQNFQGNSNANNIADNGVFREVANHTGRRVARIKRVTKGSKNDVDNNNKDHSKIENTRELFVVAALVG